MSTRAEHTIVLAGVGGDAHSIGLIILCRMLARSGYRVHYLGTQNSVDDICTAAVGAHAVMVSNMDGHAQHYLRDLDVIRDEYALHDTIWYLGGNPSVVDDDQATAKLVALGFDRVFTGFVDMATIIDVLDSDLGVELDPDVRTLPTEPVRSAKRSAAVTELAEAFADQRPDVLQQWHTGADARDLEPGALVMRAHSSLAEAQNWADAQGRTLIQPRTGVSGVTEQRELFHALRESGADVLSFQVDSLTRNNAYADVEMALKTRATGDVHTSALNGFPLVNHGVQGLRAITSEFRDVPLQVRHSTRDPRLLAEISFAGGVSAYEGGAITYNLPYYRDYQVRESVARWRYVDRLAGLYHERFGVVIDREFFGVLTASLVPPFVAIAVNVLEALLAAEGGVKSVSLGYAEQGHRAQDVAALIAMRELGRRYLDRYGFRDVAVHTVFHQYMGAFPKDGGKARELLRGSAVTAGCSGATRLMLKTDVEASRIPTAEENGHSLRLVRAALTGAGPADVDRAAVEAERELVIAEVVAVVDAALRAGSGDPGESVVAAIDLGLIDIPFSPSVWNAGKAISMRDASGAVRLVDAGNMPLPQDVRDHHAELIGKRMRRSTATEHFIEEDVLRVARGEFDTWPLG